MKTFSELKKEIISQYPSVKTLGWLDRIKIKLNPREYEYTVSDQEGHSMCSQTAVLVDYRGKTYVKRFGKLY